MLHVIVLVTCECKLFFIEVTLNVIKFIYRLPTLSVSTMFKGVQMVPVLNACNIAAAVYGNHDFGK